MTSAVDTRLEETQKEMRHLREAYQKQSDKLGKAEEALRFYANPKSYSYTNEEPTGAVFQNRVIDDFEKADFRTHVAGKRARVYFEEVTSE